MGVKTKNLVWNGEGVSSIRGQSRVWNTHWQCAPLHPGSIMSLFSENIATTV